jgi:hypothetical protein
MPTFRTVQSEKKVKVAVVFELDRVRPVWFEILGRPRVQVGEICGTWYHNEGSARIINFDIWDGRERYQLIYNTQELTWGVGLTVIE